jgi:hypothetical protein
LSYFDDEDFDNALIWFEKAKIAEDAMVNEGKTNNGFEDLAFYLNNIGLCHYHTARPGVPEDQDMLKLSIDHY